MKDFLEKVKCQTNRARQINQRTETEARTKPSMISQWGTKWHTNRVTEKVEDICTYERVYNIRQTHIQKHTYNLHVKTCILDLQQFESSFSSVVSLSWQEVGMLFNANYIWNNKYFVGEIHQWWKLWLIFCCDSEIPLSTIEQNLLHKWIMLMMRFELRSHICTAKTMTFLTRNQWVSSLILIITIGKTSTAKGLNKLEIQRYFWKSIVASGTNQRMI